MPSDQVSIEAFARESLADFLGAKRAAALHEVQSEDPDRLLTMIEAPYLADLVNRYRCPQIDLDWDRLEMTSSERLIHPAPRQSNDPLDYSYRHELPAVRRQVLTFHVPFAGDPDALLYQPSQVFASNPTITIGEGEISFEVVDYGQGEPHLKAEMQRLRHLLEDYSGFSNANIAGYNQSLLTALAREVASRKSEILRQRNRAADFGVPLRKNLDVPATFTVPIQRRRIPPKPSGSTDGHRPEPAISDEVYSQILQVIFDFGRCMERLPSIYRGRREEDLRDLFIMMLSPHFTDGSVTGETFNKYGKTDILVRHAGGNVFVAECKFWQGPKGFADAISQCLSYLTFRDSKTAVVMFVKNLQLQPTLDGVDQAVPKHPCYVATFARPAEGWRDYEFRLPNDETRRIRLAVLCFHFPPAVRPGSA